MGPRWLVTFTLASAVAGPLTAMSSAGAAPACFGYAPESIEVIGALGRQSFWPEPISDLFVDPKDVEVDGVPPPGLASGENLTIGATALPQEAAPGSPPPPLTSAISVSGANPANPADFIGPPIPAALLAPDPVLLQARPVPKPPLPDSVWVLTLPKPVCVQIEAGDMINQPEKNVRQLQLIMDKELEPGLRPLLKKRVVVRGQLFHATSRRHYLPVLVNVEDLRSPEWVQDTTQRPRPPPQ
ncbi:MAG: DUF4431 domain-containing protein [Rhodospirillales bacterium]